MKPAPVAVNTAVNKPTQNTSKASWLGRILRIIFLFLLLLIAAFITLPHWLPWLLQQQGIDFQWQNPEWHYDGFSAAQLQVRLPSETTSPQQLQLDNLRVDWAWQALPIRRLQASRLQVQWPINTSDSTDTPAGESPLPALIRWLPQAIEIDEIHAQLEGLGDLKGALKLQANAQGKLWQPSFITTQLTLDNLQGSWLDNIPNEYQPNQLSVQITTHPDHQDTPDGQQLLTVDLHTEGPMRVQLNGLLELKQSPSWQGTLSNAQLFAQLDALKHPALSTQQLQARLYFTAQADSQRFNLSLAPHSSIEAQKVQLPDIARADKASVQLAGLHLQGQSAAPFNMRIDSPIAMQMTKLNIEQLHQQNWDFKGDLKGELPQLELSGNLSGEQGLSLTTDIRLLENTVQGSAVIKEIFFKAGNPLQKTLKDWPELVSFNSGRLRSQVDFTLPDKAPLQLTINGSASGLTGIINRSELKNLGLQFNGQLTGEKLKLSIANLNIEQLNPGIPIGPIQLQGGHYQAELNNLLQGVADWQHVQANLLNGKVWLNPQKLDLKQPQTLALQVQG